MYGGGRKIWNPKDERAWVHDRFEEMTIHDSRRDDVSYFFLSFGQIASVHSKSSVYH